jgi:hypothetical protein
MNTQNKIWFITKSSISLLFALLIFPAPYKAMATNTGYTSDDSVAPESAKEIESNFQAPEIKPEKMSLFPVFREKIQTLPPFWRDTSLTLNFRTYYFNRDRDGSSNNEAWALGGSLDYQSGRWRDRLQIGLVGYTSQKLYGPESKGGTQLLKPV